MTAQQRPGTEVTEASSDLLAGGITDSVPKTADNPPPLTPEQARLVAAILFGGGR